MGSDVVSLFLLFSGVCAAKCATEDGIMLNVIGFITSVGGGGLTGLMGVELFTGGGSELDNPFWIGFSSVGDVEETALGLEVTVCSPDQVLLFSSLAVSLSFTCDGGAFFLS